MKNLNLKTGLTRKKGVLTGAVMTLAAATVLSMAPTSQAFAYLRFEVMQQAPSNNQKGTYKLGFIGHGNSHDKAKKHSKEGTSCNVSNNAGRFAGKSTSIKQPYILPQTWWGGTWFNAKYEVTCSGTYSKFGNGTPPGGSRPSGR